MAWVERGGVESEGRRGEMFMNDRGNAPQLEG